MGIEEDGCNGPAVSDLQSKSLGFLGQLFDPIEVRLRQMALIDAGAGGCDAANKVGGLGLDRLSQQPYQRPESFDLSPVVSSRCEGQRVDAQAHWIRVETHNLERRQGVPEVLDNNTFTVSEKERAVAKHQRVRCEFSLHC